VNRNHLDSHVPPRFAAQPIANITPQDVWDWFAAMHATPVFAARQG